MDNTQTDEFYLKKSEIMIATGDFRRNAFAYVTEGSLAIRELNYYGVDKGIGPGESAIKALALGQDGRVYGATSGTRAHLFVYDPNPAADHVVDLGEIAENEGICNCLVVTKTGRIIGGTTGSGLLFSYENQDDYSLLWKYEHGPIRQHGSPVPGSGIHTLCLSRRDGKVYGLCVPAGVLFCWDPESDSFEQCADLEKEHLSRILVEDDDGKLWGAERNGELFRFDPGDSRMERPGIRLPGGKGLDFVNEWDAATECRDGIIYGGTIGGHLFSLDTRTGDIFCFGKPIPGPRIRAMTMGKDGWVYGIAGKPGHVSHLFKFDLKTGRMKDLGVPMVGFPKAWTGYEFDAMLCGGDGQIYLGESDRISHLFIYYPPVTA